ncbi:uncharacterized protein LOC62_05G007250 [Vanrija pseudolonga]|uniref:Uncharacterized protein n=1 Tax=Vanrija pseudolonga TaxID=143232 RepID=A0AAF1BNZ9_9TREE|nr:hypothetical protein LOC62_05G007250 [Vanrija pseudolonga]
MRSPILALAAASVIVLVQAAPQLAASTSPALMTTTTRASSVTAAPPRSTTTVTRLALISGATYERRELRALDALRARQHGLLAAAIVPCLLLSLFVLPLVLVKVRTYRRATRDMLANAPPEDINRTWVRKSSMSSMATATAALATAPLLAKPVAAAPVATITATRTISPDMSEAFFSALYAPDRQAAQRVINSCTIAAPIGAGVPIVIMAGVVVHAYLEHRRALRLIESRKVEYWGVNTQMMT